jgi:lysophospholipase L1-like esterase
MVAEVEGYAGQNIIECSEKRDLQLPVGTADGRDEEDEWKAIFEAHKAIGEEYGSEVDLLLFGDDTIAAWGGAHEDDFESALGARYNAVPFGIAGDTALNALWRLQNGEASRINAKSVVLHVGANDIDRYIPSEVRTSDDFGEKEMQRRIDVAADRVANATQAAALQILKSNCDVTVLVLGLIPREDESYESINAAVNARLRAFGESDYIKGIDFLDCRDALSDRRGRFDSGLYERDGVRLNDRGMKALAVCIQENLLEVDDLTRVESMGRSFYKEARAGTIFNSVDHRISVLPELPRDVDDCDEWKELNLSDGSADMRLSDPQWVSDHEQYSRVIDAFGKHVHLAFFGDDNTLRWNSEGRRVFEERYAFKYNALALGKGGDTSQNLIWRLRNGELGGPESSFAPDAVVLNVGSNDLLAYVRQSALLGDEGDDVLEDAAEAVGRSIQHAVGAIKQASCQTQVVVLGLLPRGDLDGGRDFRDFKDMHEHVNKFLERWADDLEGVTFVDCSRALLDGSRVERDFYERNYVELNRDGFEDLADCLDDTLKDLLPREDDALSLRTNLILSDPDGADLLSSDLASLFSAEDLDTDCRAESDRTCYRATRVPLDERTTSAYECEDWLELDLPDGSLDGRDDERDWERAHDKIVDVLDDIDSAAEVFPH